MPRFTPCLLLVLLAVLMPVLMAVGAVAAELDTDDQVAELLVAFETAAATPEKAPLAYELGTLLFTHGRLDESRPYLQLALHADLTAPQRHRVEAALRNTQRIGTLQRIYPRSFEVQPLLEKAQEAITQGRIDEAFALLTRINREHPGSLIPAGESRMIGASRQVERLLAGLSEQQRGIYTNLVRREVADQNIHHASQWLELIRLYPVEELRREWWRNAGNYYLTTGSYGLAASAFRRAGEPGQEGLQIAEDLRRQRLESRRPDDPGHMGTGGMVGEDNPQAYLEYPPAFYNIRDLLLSGDAAIDPVPVHVDPALGMRYFWNGEMLTGVAAGEPGHWRFAYSLPGRPPARNPIAFQIDRYPCYRSPAPCEIATEDGVLVFRDVDPDGNSTVVALDAGTGLHRWTSATSPVLRHLRIVSGPAVRGGVVAVALIEPGRLGQYAVYGLDLHTGNLLWRTLVFAGAGSTHGIGQGELDVSRTAPALVMDDQRVYYGSHMGAVAALDRLTGEMDWIREYPGLIRVGPEGSDPVAFFNRVTQRPVLTDDALVFAPRDSHTILVLSKSTGTVLAEHRSFSRVALLRADRERFYLRHENNGVEALNFTDARRVWKRQLEGALVGTGVLTDAGLRLRLDGEIVTLDPSTGEESGREPYVEPVLPRDAMVSRAPETVGLDVPDTRITRGDVRRLTSTADILLVETPLRLEARQPVAPFGLLWQTPLPSASLATEIAPDAVYWLGTDGIIALDKQTGEEQWRWPDGSVEGLPFRDLFRIAGETLLLTHDFGAVALDANGRQQWSFEVDPGEQVKDADLTDGRPLLLQQSPGSPARLVEVSPADGNIARETAVLFPAGLTKRATLDPATVAAAALGEPARIGEDRVRYEPVRALWLTVQNRLPHILTAHGLLILDADGSQTWIPLRPALGGFAQLKVMSDSSIIQEWQENRELRFITITADDVREELLGAPLALAHNRLYTVHWERQQVLDARDLVTGETLWSSEPLPGGMSASHLAYTPWGLAVATANRASGSHELRLLDAETGKTRAVTSLPLQSVEALEVFAGGLSIRGNNTNAWMALPSSATVGEPGRLDAALEAQEWREKVWSRSAAREDRELPVHPGAKAVDGNVGDWRGGYWAALIPGIHWNPDPGLVSQALPLPPDAADLSARAAFAVENGSLLGCVMVRDDEHWGRGSEALSDGLTVAVRNPARVMLGNESAPVVFRIALTESGVTVRHQGMDIPVETGQQRTWPFLHLHGIPAVERALEEESDNPLRVAVRRSESDGVTIYEFALPLLWAGYGQGEGNDADTAEIRLSVHENDGDGYEGALDWAPAPPELRNELWGTVPFPATATPATEANSTP